jgi:NAD-dependent dihydropyrimidine dehydrogenase PreA subunit
MFVVTVDQKICIGCEECTKACPAQVLGMEDSKAQAVGDDCLGCQSCEMVCPVTAIKVQEF